MPEKKNNAASQKREKPSGRALAFRSLLRMEEEKRFSSLELDNLIKSEQPDSRERALYTELFYGVIRRKLTLDALIRAYSSKPPEKLDPPVAAALRLGLYQILYLDRIPDSAAVSESVELVKKKAKSAASFVNAILRRACRDREADALPLPSDDGSAESREVIYSCPAELIRSFEQDYGKERCTAILEAFTQRPPVTLRVNSLKTDRDSLLRSLKENGTDAVPNGKYGVTVRGGAVSGLKELKDGLCYVQNVASQKAVEALAPKPGEFLIDVCAAPGGKSIASALCMENRGRILSRDLHENKLPLIARQAEKLGIGIIVTEARDASLPDNENEGRADLVICDLPCSGYGDCAGKPETRYKPLAEAERLPEIQYRILCAASGLVRDGGTLMYSTCTLRKAENEENVLRFASSHPGFRPLDGDGVTVFPRADDPENGGESFACDGFFYARFQKVKQ